MIATGDIGALNTPTNSILAQCAGVKTYSAAAPNTPLNNQSVTPAGGSQPHENMQPFLVISFIISLFGRFPPPQ
jgi:microcystin-dependent protein